MPRRHLDRRLKLRLLRVLDALEAQRSLVKAAAALGLGQPALSRSLAELEEVAGQPLFLRHPRGVRPTEAGLVLVAAARRALAELRRAEEALDRLSTPDAGSVVIGALPVAAAGVLPGVLARLGAAHPGVTARLQEGRTEELLPLLAAGEVDLVVGRLYPPAVPDGLLREALWEEPISILARPGHPILAAPTAAALAAAPLVLPTVSQRVGQEIDLLLDGLGVDLAAPLRSGSYALIRELLLAGQHVAVMPRLMLLGDLLRGSLEVVPLPLPAPPRPAGLILPRGRAPSPAARAFILCLRATLAEVAARGLSAMPIGDTGRGKSDATGRRRRG